MTLEGKLYYIYLAYNRSVTGPQNILRQKASEEVTAKTDPMPSAKTDPMPFAPSFISKRYLAALLPVK